MTSAKLFLIVPAVGIFLAACGSSTTTVTATVSPAAAKTATPAASASPSTNAGQQFLSDVAAWNAATAGLKTTDTISSPDVIAAAQQAANAGRLMLQQTWPSNAQSDVHALALAYETINEDVQQNNYAKFKNDVTGLNAAAQVVRAELGLPAIK